MNPSPAGNNPPSGLPNLPIHFTYDPSLTSASAPSSVAKSISKKAPGRQITRNRASYSCHTCRRRKVKCDKVHPICGNCGKNGTECIYDPTSHKDEAREKDGHGVKRRREASRHLEDDFEDLQSMYGRLSHAGPSEQKSIEARLDKLTSMIERLSKAPQPLDPAEQQLLAQSAPPGPTKSEFRGIDGYSTPDSPRRTADSSSDEFPIPAGHATDLVDPVGSLNLGHLSLEDGRSRYVGTTFWAYISHEINDLNQLLRDQTHLHETSGANEVYTEETVDHAAKSHWLPSVDNSNVSTGGRLSAGDAFQSSVLFSTNGSPSVKDKVVEPDMLDYVPTKRQSHVLYKGFMSGIHAISPVLHPPTVLKQYNAFWDWYDSSSYSGESCPDPSFIPLLYAIWYGGSVTVSLRTIKAEFNGFTRTALSKTYNDQVTRWLSQIAFPRSPSLQGLAAYLLVQTILAKEEEPLTSSLFVSLAMRVAQTMGLHRDPANFGIGPAEAESRRRMWWHIVHMDGVVSMSSGLPPLVNEEAYWDVRETNEVKDTLLGLPEAEEYEKLVQAGIRPRDNPDDPTVCGGPSMVNVYYCCVRGKYIMARAVRRIMRIQLGTKPVTRRDMEELRSILVDLQGQLNSIADRIPQTKQTDVSPNASTRSWSFSRSPTGSLNMDTILPGDAAPTCTEQYHTPVLVNFHKWARIILSLYADKVSSDPRIECSIFFSYTLTQAFCVAYQPFLKNAKSRIWPAARQSALRHCHGFMEKFISLATDPDFQPFHWSWPGNHQPMHATMIMLIDLYERPYSPEAPKSRAFIDKIFSLTGPDGGVVGGEDGISTQRPLKDGGREAWDMIRRLRHKAWQKAGLDPQKLWTEQAQIQAGAAIPDDCIATNASYSGSSAYLQPIHSRDQLLDFGKAFYSMTRSQALPSIAATLQGVNSLPRSSSLRYQISSTAPVSSQNTIPTTRLISSSPEYPNSPHSSTGASPVTVPATVSNANIVPFTHQPGTSPPTISFPQGPSMPMAPPAQAQVSTAQSSLPFLDALSPPSPPLNFNVPTPPSMIDPNLNFDWDQWDAVFGQHLPVSDELMELDPVTGFEFGGSGSGRVSRTGSITGSEPGMRMRDASIEMRSPGWNSYC
ncbi:fungal-specific transcription factor domain-containing protein [Aspergillus granulosus]|uniref:Fungal-specific transcription factor domain-containing protein n=1 Tax=Aspergillus granulosus TaxID=176169 RepID=A0ABR4I5M0_9EURO